MTRDKRQSGWMRMNEEKKHSKKGEHNASWYYSTLGSNPKALMSPLFDTQGDLDEFLKQCVNMAKKRKGGSFRWLSYYDYENIAGIINCDAHQGIISLPCYCQQQ